MPSPGDERTAEREALVEAVIPLEVIAGQDRVKPYKELSRDLIAQVNRSIETVREALSIPRSPKPERTAESADRANRPWAYRECQHWQWCKSCRNAFPEEPSEEAVIDAAEALDEEYPSLEAAARAALRAAYAAERERR